MKHIIFILAGVIPFVAFISLLMGIIFFGEYLLIGIVILGPIIFSYSAGKDMYDSGKLDWILKYIKD